MDVPKDDNVKPSFDEAGRRRIFAFISAVGLDVYFGSLWWVDESIWKTIRSL
jgi:hypothetical protein